MLLALSSIFDIKYYQVSKGDCPIKFFLEEFGPFCLPQLMPMIIIITTIIVGCYKTL